MRVPGKQATNKIVFLRPSTASISQVAVRSELRNKFFDEHEWWIFLIAKGIACLLATFLTTLPIVATVDIVSSSDSVSKKGMRHNEMLNGYAPLILWIYGLTIGALILMKLYYVIFRKFFPDKWHLQGLSNKDSGRRLDALIFFSSRQNLINLKLISSLLEDENEIVAKHALTTLDELGWKPSNEQEAIPYLFARDDLTNLARFGHLATPYLIKLSTNRFHFAREKAIKALGLIGDPSAISVLSDLADYQDNRAVSFRAAVSIFMINHRSINDIISLSQSGDESTRSLAISALGVFGGQRAIEVLVKLLLEVDSLAGIAAKALQDMGWRPSNEVEKIAYILADGKGFGLRDDDRFRDFRKYFNSSDTKHLSKEDERLILKGIALGVPIRAEFVEPVYEHYTVEDWTLPDGVDSRTNLVSVGYISLVWLEAAPARARIQLSADEFVSVNELLAYLAERSPNIPKNPDVLVVLGNPDHQINGVAAARIYHELNPKWVLVAGNGKGARPEAHLFREVLIQNGVPEDRILVEDKSMNTGENARFGSKVLRDELAAKDPDLLNRSISMVIVQKPISQRLSTRILEKQFSWLYPITFYAYAPRIPTVNEQTPEPEVTELIKEALDQVDRFPKFESQGFINEGVSQFPEPINHAVALLRAAIVRSELRVEKLDRVESEVIEAQKIWQSYVERSRNRFWSIKSEMIMGLVGIALIGYALGQNSAFSLYFGLAITLLSSFLIALIRIKGTAFVEQNSRVNNFVQKQLDQLNIGFAYAILNQILDSDRQRLEMGLKVAAKEFDDRANTIKAIFLKIAFTSRTSVVLDQFWGDKKSQLGNEGIGEGWIDFDESVTRVNYKPDSEEEMQSEEWQGPNPLVDIGLLPTLDLWPHLNRPKGLMTRVVIVNSSSFKSLVDRFYSTKTGMWNDRVLLNTDPRVRNLVSLTKTSRSELRKEITVQSDVDVGSTTIRSEIVQSDSSNERLRKSVEDAARANQDEVISIEVGESVRSEALGHPVIFEKVSEIVTTTGELEITVNFKVIATDRREEASGALSVSSVDGAIFDHLSTDIDLDAKSELGEVLGLSSKTTSGFSVEQNRSIFNQLVSLFSVKQSAESAIVFTHNAFFGPKGNLALIADRLAASYGRYLVVYTNRAELDVIRRINQNLKPNKRIIAVPDFKKAVSAAETRLRRKIHVVGVAEDALLIKAYQHSIWSQSVINGLLAGVERLIVQFQAALHLAYSA